jgi:arginine/lysine/ornithine decarboxylase
MTIDLNGMARGNEVAKILEQNNIYIELYNDDYLLFMLSYKFDIKSANKLIEALLQIKTNKRERSFFKSYFPTRKIGYINAILADSELIEISSASGRVCAENAGIFPPCYPIILAGEVFDNSVISRLLAENTFGCYGNKVKVVKEEEGC